jgi:hypothetical protein
MSRGSGVGMIFVYKTTNLINGKFYFGVHKSSNFDNCKLK